ncbi:MAG: hypothetical protein N2248_04245 [candidate division WOR-3 bacterium]|nr:hypothetical protein [candidate division WOR-3 bacterium]
MADLKRQKKITSKEVECPVKGCNQKVERQRVNFAKKPEFKCPEHKIYISPTTFEYENPKDNFLWSEDNDLLERIKNVKRVQIMLGRDTSEDAVTWNVFRFLERHNLIVPCLQDKIPNLEATRKKPEIIYWSYSQEQDNTWQELKAARREFESRGGSEPDIIVKYDNTLIIIEAKLTSPNKTPSGKKEIPKKIDRTKAKYTNGGGRWFTQVFHSDFETIMHDQKYELMRFWLLGTWVANKNNLDFYLVNLVRDGKENDIEKDFGKHIICSHQKPRRCFVRITWEDIYRYIKKSGLSGKDVDIILRYFENKSVGYKVKVKKSVQTGELQKAFSI